MAIARVGTNRNLGQAVGDYVDVAFPSANTAGNLIVVCVTSDETSAGVVPIVTDTRGNTYRSVLASQASNSGSPPCAVTIFYAYNCAGGANTVRVNGSGGSGNTQGVTICEYSGALTTDPLDKGPAANVQASGTTRTTTSTGTLSQADELAVALISSNNGGTAFTPYAAGGWAQVGENESWDYIPFSTIDRVVSATTSLSGQWDIGQSSFPTVALIATFKAAATGPSPVTGAGAATLPALTAAIAGSVVNPTTGTVAGVLPALTATATGVQTFAGTGAASLPALTAQATGYTFGGALTATLPALSGAATGAETFAASGVASLPTLGASGAASLAFGGAVACSLSALGAAAAAAQAFSGAISAALPGLTAAVVGEAEQVGNYGAATLPAFTGQATGAQTFDGAVSASLPGLGASAAGAEAFEGVLSASLPGLTATASGEWVATDRIGEVAATLPSLAAAGVGALTFAGVIAGALPLLTAHASEARAVTVPLSVRPRDLTLVAATRDLTLAARARPLRLEVRR